MCSPCRGWGWNREWGPSLEAPHPDSSSVIFTPCTWSNGPHKCRKEKQWNHIHMGIMRHFHAIWQHALLNEQFSSHSVGCAILGNLILQTIFRICRGWVKLSRPSGLQWYVNRPFLVSRQIHTCTTVPRWYTGAYTHFFNTQSIIRTRSDGT